MVLSDEVFLIALVTLINFFLIYRKNKLAGNMFFLLIGGGIIYISVIRGIEAMFLGVIVLLGGMMSLVHDLLSTNPNEER